MNTVSSAKPPLNLYMLFKLYATKQGETDKAVVLATNPHEAREIMYRAHADEDEADEWLAAHLTGVTYIHLDGAAPRLVMASIKGE